MSEQLALLREITLPAMVERSIKLLQTHEPSEGYYGCFSGGKDSCVIKELARMAGVKATWHYNVTTIDPPELLWFIKKNHPDVVWEKPPCGNFFSMMEKRGIPTRKCRWCCSEYKEMRSPRRAVLLLGVRSAESPRRAAAWKEVTQHRATKSYAVSPILKFTDQQVWEFINSTGIPYCSLYNEGFKRLGCIGCPMGGKHRLAEFARWPKYEALWKRAFQRVWHRRTHDSPYQKDGREWFGSAKFSNWEELWDWWLSDLGLPGNEEDSCQLALDMFSGGNE